MLEVHLHALTTSRFHSDRRGMVVVHLPYIHYIGQREQRSLRRILRASILAGSIAPSSEK